MTLTKPHLMFSERRHQNAAKPRLARPAGAALATHTLSAIGDSEGASEKILAGQPHAQTVTIVADQLWEWAELGYPRPSPAGSCSIVSPRPALRSLRALAASHGVYRHFRQRCPGDWHHGGVRRPARDFSGCRAASLKRLRLKPSGHACGHNLFGAGSLGAALAVKDWLEASGQPGTVRFYGTPAEEGIGQGLLG